MRQFIVAAVLLNAAVPAPARPPMLAGPDAVLDSAVFVEHAQLHGGTLLRVLEPAQRLSRGDRVVTMVNWTRLGGRGAFTVVDALPSGLAYQASADGDEEVSVDGGRIWASSACSMSADAMPRPKT
jgi:hypothetical protein